MVCEEVYLYRIWDHKNNKWWLYKPYQGAARTTWESFNKARAALSRRIGKDKWEDDYSIIKCKVVPVEEDVVMAQFKQL